MTELKKAPWDLSVAEQKYKPKEFPLVSIIIPTSNAAQLIGPTLESLLNQDYPGFEIIIVDNSQDRTLEVIKNFHNNKLKVYSVAQSKRYEMLNKGLSQAKGEYVNFLFPGDYYIFHETLKQMMLLALEHNKPQLVYCGTLLRDAHSEAKILFRELSLELLKKGQQPTSLQSCWFQTKFIKEIGKFNPEYSMRGGFDLLCRFCLHKGTFSSVNRVLTDYDLRAVTRQMVATHFWETMKTLYKYFGLSTVILWLFFHQKDWKRYLKLWLHSLRVAFSGP